MTLSAVARLEQAVGPGCVLVCRSISDSAPLTGEEAAAIAKAVPARRAEFAAGRAAARQALAQLGMTGVSIPMDADRAPQWPRGIVGSISHAAGFAIALVASSEDVLGVGVDIEPDAPLPVDAIETVLTPDEQVDRGRTRAIFCAKEATYKALYPLAGAIWDFQDMRIRLDSDGNRFAAELDRSAGPVAAGTVVGGHLIIDGGLCVAAVVLPKR
ncbi:4'-phosphopantetheinyl transferase superfamily protein [Ponticoccus sp. SC2-23]|uniref:4'-phosphopantetheinyl transferase family protein n=1 Tax=Alexandriicola marinus TaxID=2081710 RepID=UPI000FDAA24B|nr:4'-phosphopantetheinyl transferase superfamily protein [Alexandriicola marinus]MBM1220407.1 4'-phosphopantetheinyl transferase superfamily protein [Ponticoccus sp. SC6-9]MBM1225093.1 4'-phosphopantetheinyl transferase superfamily protein [Ponticoccus sp. SC6-15]MBM1228607.1 4'-phosphopantetheinyl transferase superfamily protein [Ponticoccus sp. SC6-38]MBM1233756.1 4'-phosphopantetheinyl transferase superfamily protein [Ponticoccus sp. SC6-45]MBM1239108.1 4'-phosphopantetheinyl transferase s